MFNNGSVTAPAGPGNRGRSSRTASETLSRLVHRPIEIGIDTEYDGRRTLTIQAACRLRADSMAIQVYHDNSVPELPKLDVSRYFPPGREDYGRFFKKLTIRPAALITPCLSPSQFLRDLLGLRDVAFLSRKEGRERLSSGPDGGPRNGEWDDRAGRWKIPALKITLVGHFLPADLTRIFGNAFLLDLLETGGVRFSAREPLGIVEPRDKFHTSPVVEYIETCAGDLFAVMVETRDTMLPFGPASLEQHSQTFLGLGKLEGLSEADKADMSRTFQKKPRRAYAYAIRDAVNTLLVFEEMQKKDRDLYHHFGIRDEDIPSMRPTVGGRVADFLCRMTEKMIGNRSNHLRSSRDIRFLMKQGNSALFQHGVLPSVLGVETALVHGGLNIPSAWESCVSCEVVGDTDALGDLHTGWISGGVLW